MEHKNDTQIASLIKEKLADLESELETLQHNIDQLNLTLQVFETNSKPSSYHEKIILALKGSEQTGHDIIRFILSHNQGDELEIKKAVSKELSRLVKNGKIKVRKIKGVNYYKE